MSRHALHLLLIALLTACGATDAPDGDDTDTDPADTEPVDTDDTDPADTDETDDPEETDDTEPPEPALVAATPVPGERLALLVEHVAPGATVAFLRGSALGTGACPATYETTCVDVLDPVALDEATADADGAARIDVVVPAATPVGETLALQALIDGVALPALEATVSAPLAIGGVWEDDFGSEHEIETRRWLSFGSAEIVLFSNDGRYAVARNGDDTFAPGLWSRYDWTHVGDDLWYCQTRYDAATLADALATPAADASDPTDGGCSGFAWSHLRPAALAIAGDPTDASEVHHVIDGTLWEQGAASFHVTRFSNAERWVIAQNDAGNPSHPLLWSRFDWAEVGDEVWYCATRGDAATELEARESTPADATDVANGGCNGSAWILLVP